MAKDTEVKNPRISPLAAPLVFQFFRNACSRAGISLHANLHAKYFDTPGGLLKVRAYIGIGRTCVDEMILEPEFWSPRCT